MMSSISWLGLNAKAAGYEIGFEGIEAVLQGHGNISVVGVGPRLSGSFAIKRVYGKL